MLTIEGHGHTTMPLIGFPYGWMDNCKNCHVDGTLMNLCWIFSEALLMILIILSNLIILIFITDNLGV